MHERKKIILTITFLLGVFNLFSVEERKITILKLENITVTATGSEKKI
ncbi:MAG: hypothetical protein U9O87_07825 [Verrucomicrobiota bacterium]|nr:hypothetical protein [Verrucomicrobiota bacterium]